MILHSMKRLIAAGLLMGSLLDRTAAADFPQAAEALDARVEQAVTGLAEVTREIEEEKVPLIKERNLLEAQVIKLRQDVARLESLKSGRDALVNAGEKELKARRDEVDYLTGLIADYARSFETRIHIAEVQRYRNVINPARDAANDGNLTKAEKLDRQLPLITAAIGRAAGLLGGDSFQGEVLRPDGRMIGGRLTLLGPVTLFAGEGGDSVGTVEMVLGSPEPTLVASTAQQSAELRKLAAKGAGSLPLDPSGGNARKLAATKDTLMQQWKKGGPVMVPILALGFVSLLVGLIKWFQIAHIRQATGRDVQIIIEHLRGGRKGNALDHAEQMGGPAGKMMRRAVENAGEDRELIEETLYEQMLDTRPRLEKLMPLIALTAATAPLLGLLGTVTGMINTFNLISVFGTGDPRTLSSGISEALITTMYGLIVAIPALLLHAAISRRAKGLLGSMEQAAVAFVNGVPRNLPAKE